MHYVARRRTLLCGQEYYSYPATQGKNRKYIGIPVPLTRIRMLYHQSKLRQENSFSSGFPSGYTLGKFLRKAVPALASTGGILKTIKDKQDKYEILNVRFVF